MKKGILAIVAAAVASSVLAQTKAPTELPCPLMVDQKVNIAKATKSKLFSDYKGRRYFFCCGGCLPAFKKDPAKFAKVGMSIPTPKKKA